MFATGCALPSAIQCRRVLRRVATVLAVAATVCSPPVFAQSDGDEGLEAGPWLFRPYFVASYDVSDNVFLRSEDAALSDQVRSTRLGTSATLFFSNSHLELLYEGARRVYDARGLSDIISHELEASLNLRFGNGSKLIVSDTYSRGNTDVQRIDDGGERTFDGERFDLNEWVVDFSRDVPRIRGYRLRLRGQDLAYRESVAAFFDFEGIDATLEYREPINSTMWLTTTYQVRRADHSEAGEEATFRRERRESLRLGFRGQSGGGQPYFLNLGAERFRYEGRNATEYSGLSVQGQWQLSVGREGSLRLLASRRALPSVLGTYYLVNELDVGFDRRLLLRSSVGIKARFSRNAYGDRVDLDRDGVVETFRRREALKSAQAYVEFRPSPIVRLRLGVLHRKRESNYEPADYENNVFSTSVGIGWAGD